MSFAPPDTPEDEPSSVFAPADSEPDETPSAVTFMPLSPEDVARDNARGGCWAMNEYYDGCVLLGVDDKPVMRNDGSRVGFFFRDAQRLADELAAGSEPGAVASGNDPDERAAAWRAHRRALAPLDAGFNKDWDPQRPKSTRADMTKWTRLLAYYYAQSTEPEEAVRHVVSDIFGKPLNGPRMRLWVPGKHNAETVQAVADELMRQAIRDASDANINSAPFHQAAIKTNTSLRVDSHEREDINRALRNKGTKLRREQLESDSLDTTPPKAPPNVDIDANIDEALKKKGDNRWFYNQVNDNGPWDYKRQGGEFEDFGNFNYGATGAALGYTEATLLRMAGWNHARNNPQRPENGVAASLPGAYLGIGGVAPYGDDTWDQYWIRRGYRYYKERH